MEFKYDKEKAMAFRNKACSGEIYLESDSEDFLIWQRDDSQGSANRHHGCGG